jgi:integrase-like protein
MPASRPLERTRVPGIFKRGNRYVVIYRDPTGRQRKRSARTLAEARDLKATLAADVARGEYRTLSKITFADYAAGWIDTYQGRTSRGIDESTRADYRKRLEQDAIPFFGRTPLAAIEPRHLKEYLRHLAAPRTAAELENGRRRRTIAPSTVRLGVAPVRALLATAVEEGLIRSNPAAGLRIAGQRETFDESGASEADVKALSPDDLARLLAKLDNEWRLFFEFLGQTGLRIGEAVELRWRDVDLGAGTVKVRSPLLPRPRRPAQVEVRQTHDPAGLADGASALAAPEEDSRRRRGACLHGRAWGASRCLECDEPGPKTRGRCGRPRRVESIAEGRPGGGYLGQLPHLPAYLRDCPLPGGLERRSSATVPRPSQGLVHARHVRTPAR